MSVSTWMVIFISIYGYAVSQCPGGKFQYGERCCSIIDCNPGEQAVPCEGCVPCRPGTFMEYASDTDDIIFCSTHTLCNEDQVIKIQGTTTKNTVCACKEGYLATSKAPSGCQLMNCQPGSEFDIIKLDCMECPNGTFKSGSGKEKCQNCTSCFESDKDTKFLCNLTHDSVCAAASQLDSTGSEKDIWWIILAAVAAAAVITVVCVYLCWRKKYFCWKTEHPQSPCGDGSPSTPGVNNHNQTGPDSPSTAGVNNDNQTGPDSPSTPGVNNRNQTGHIHRGSKDSTKENVPVTSPNSLGFDVVHTGVDCRNPATSGAYSSLCCLEPDYDTLDYGGDHQREETQPLITKDKKVPSNEDIKSKVIANFARICTIDPKGPVLNTLFEKGVLTNREYSSIVLAKDEDCGSELLRLLLKGGNPKIFIHLLEGLKKDKAYEWIVELIENSDS